MKFRPATLETIASYICGDPPLPFPYRSSSKLTSFFTGLDLDCIHHGETRNPWTRDALIEINRGSGSVGGYPSAQAAVHAVIEEIMNPEYYEGGDENDYQTALKTMNKTLLPYRLEVVFDETNWSCRLVSVDGTFVSTAHRSPDKATKITFSPRVFEVPESVETRKDLVAVMMPFGGFDGVHSATRAACTSAGMESITSGTTARFCKTSLT